MLLAKIKTMGQMALMLTLGTGALWGVHYAAAALRADDAVPATPVAFAQDKEKKDARPEAPRKDEPYGLVKDIDLKIGTLTITSLRDGGGEQTYSLAAKDLKVGTTYGDEFKLADVVPGMRVYLQLKDLDVAALRVANPYIPAFLNRIDGDKRTVEARAERAIVHYNVAADAKLMINGKSVKLSEVPVEEKLFLTLTFDKKTILALHNVKGAVRRDGDRPKEVRPGAEKPKDREPERPRLLTANATVIDVDASKSTVSVLLGREGDLKIQTLTIAKDVKIKVIFDERPVQELTVAELTKPLQATVQMSDDGKSITTLTVLAPLTRGAVKAIDAAGKKITLINEVREEKTYDLDAAVVVRLQGRGDGKLADVAPNTSVLVGLSPDRQRVIAITTILTRRDGDR